MSVNETFYQRIETSGRNAVTFVIVAALIALLFVAAVTINQQRPMEIISIHGVSERCESASCVSTRQLIGTREALAIKRRFGGYALLVDIRSAADRAVPLPLSFDLEAPFVQASGPGGMEFRLDFAEKVDNAMRAARMGPDDPIVVLSPTPEHGVLAALLLQERGYSGVRVLYDRERIRTEATNRPAAPAEARIPIA